MATVWFISIEPQGMAGWTQSFRQSAGGSISHATDERVPGSGDHRDLRAGWAAQRRRAHRDGSHVQAVRGLLAVCQRRLVGQPSDSYRSFLVGAEQRAQAADA